MLLVEFVRDGAAGRWTRVTGDVGWTGQARDLRVKVASQRVTLDADGGERTLRHVLTRIERGGRPVWVSKRHMRTRLSEDEEWGPVTSRGVS